MSEGPSKNLTTSKVTCHKKFLNLLDISGVTMPSSRGVSPSQQSHFTFIRQVDECSGSYTEGGEKEAARVMILSIFSSSFFFFPLNALTLLQ